MFNKSITQQDSKILIDIISYCYAHKNAVNEKWNRHGNNKFRKIIKKIPPQY